MNNALDTGHCRVRYLKKRQNRDIEVIMMIDLRKETIEGLFYKQIRNLSVQKEDTFDIQLSGCWL